MDVKAKLLAFSLPVKAHMQKLPTYASPSSQPQTFGRLKKRSELKREPRHDATFRASMKGEGYMLSVQITNMSRSGMALRLIDKAPAMIGEQVTVTSPDVGILYGVARWQRGNQMGIEFTAATKTKGRIAAYFKFFRKRKVF